MSACDVIILVFKESDGNREIPLEMGIHIFFYNSVTRNIDFDLFQCKDKWIHKT